MIPPPVTRHVVAALVAVLEEIRDPAVARQRRCRAREDLAVPVILRAADTQLDRVAFGARAWRVAVHLVEDYDPPRRPPESSRAIGADEREGASAEELFRERVAAVA